MNFRSFPIPMIKATLPEINIREIVEAQPMGRDRMFMVHQVDGEVPKLGIVGTVRWNEFQNAYEDLDSVKCHFLTLEDARFLATRFTNNWDTKYEGGWCVIKLPHQRGEELFGLLTEDNVGRIEESLNSFRDKLKFHFEVKWGKKSENISTMYYRITSTEKLDDPEMIPLIYV